MLKHLIYDFEFVHVCVKGYLKTSNQNDSSYLYFGEFQRAFIVLNELFNSIHHIIFLCYQ